MSGPTNDIPFTQYLRPDGRISKQAIDRGPELHALAQLFIDRGGYFEMELLMTGDVSLTAEIEDDKGEVKTVGHEVVPNGPAVPEAVDRLVEATKEQP